MIEFVKQSYLLILGIAGTLVGAIFSITFKLYGKQKLRLWLTLYIASFLILTGQQILAHIGKQQKDAIQKMILNRIDMSTAEALTLLQGLAQRFSGRSPASIGVEIVQYSSHDELRQFAKGDIQMWRQYRDWLFSSELQNRLSCLSLTINANKHYNVDILLTYLLTNDDTEDDLLSNYKERVQSFPTFTIIEQHGIPQPRLDYILFYNSMPRELVGYADANLFSRELLLYERTGWKSKVESILNSNVSDSLFKYFSTTSRDVITSNDGYQVAKEMIEENINETIVSSEEGLYFASLARIVEIASSKEQ